MRLMYWDVIRQGQSVWVTYQVTPGYVYDPLVSCLVNNPTALNGLCASVADKTWSNQDMADELRQVVNDLAAERGYPPIEAPEVNAAGRARVEALIDEALGEK